MMSMCRDWFKDVLWGVLVLATAWSLPLLVVKLEPLAFAALGLPYGDERLWVALGDGDAAQIRRALAEGARINAVNRWGNTPLMVAAASSEARVVSILLAHGADPRQRTQRGLTALMCAVWAERIETADLLLKAGADVNAVDERGMTVSQLALGMQNSEMEALFRRFAALDQ
jgi:ankyrin repeat protein